MPSHVVPNRISPGTAARKRKKDGWYNHVGFYHMLPLKKHIETSSAQSYDQIHGQRGFVFASLASRHVASSRLGTKHMRGNSDPKKADLRYKDQWETKRKEKRQKLFQSRRQPLPGRFDFFCMFDPISQRKVGTEMHHHSKQASRYIGKSAVRACVRAVRVAGWLAG
ncbi:uncharacterized protein BKA78DRAFT_105838 [Phyllosticta capitalensis]|uniref:uncharacterized protein n=1 Tax=Phyllosticta capitalensis TaxID=121624 RepID=UPI00312DA75E